MVTDARNRLVETLLIFRLLRRHDVVPRQVAEQAPVGVLLDRFVSRLFCRLGVPGLSRIYEKFFGPDEDGEEFRTHRQLLAFVIVCPRAETLRLPCETTESVVGVVVEKPFADAQFRVLEHGGLLAGGTAAKLPQELIFVNSDGR